MSRASHGVTYGSRRAAGVLESMGKASARKGLSVTHPSNRPQVPKSYLDKYAFMKPTDETLCYEQSQQGFSPMTSEVYPGFGNDQDDFSCRAQYVFYSPPLQICLDMYALLRVAILY